MKKLIYIIIAIINFCITNHINSQNLVPNPSFETIDTCPYYANQIYFASPWFQPCKHFGNTTNSSSSDVFNSCDTSSTLVGVPSNAASFQYARTGNGYSGIYGSSETSNYREYIEIVLNTPLQVNRKYCLQFYISLADYSGIAISNMGAYFSVDSLLDTTFYHAIDYVIPQIENPNGNYLSDTVNWMLVSGNFIASGGERYLTIGNFHNPQNTDTIHTSYPNGTAYYYIDDVSLVDCTGVGEEEMGMSNVEISPNPAANQFTIENSQLRINSIHIYNVLGELVLERIANSEKVIDVSTWKAGVYFVEVETEKGVVRRKVIKSTMY